MHSHPTTFHRFPTGAKRRCSGSPWGGCWSTCCSQSFSSRSLHSRARSCLWWWRIFVPRKTMKAAVSQSCGAERNQRRSQDREVRFLDPALPIMQHNSIFHSRCHHKVMVSTFRGSSSSEDKITQLFILFFFRSTFKVERPFNFTHISSHWEADVFQTTALFFFFKAVDNNKCC